MAQKFYPGLGALPTTLETSPPGRASPQTREEGLAQLREEFTPRPIQDVLGPMGRLMLGLPMYTSPDQKMAAQRQEMDQVMSMVPPPETDPNDPMWARSYMYGLEGEKAAPLGPSASGRAVPTPTDETMAGAIMGRPFYPFALSPGIVGGQGLRSYPAGIEAETDQTPTYFPPIGLKGYKMPVLPGEINDPRMSKFSSEYPFQFDEYGM